jgi:hypothetical protein
MIARNSDGYNALPVPKSAGAAHDQRGTEDGLKKADTVGEVNVGFLRGTDPCLKLLGNQLAELQPPSRTT